MAVFQQYTHLDLLGNELQNANFQNLAQAPLNPSAGRFYFSTTDNTLYIYNGTRWVDALSQGDYVFQNGVEMAAGTRNVQLKLASGDNAGNVALTADANGLSANMSLTVAADSHGLDYDDSTGEFTLTAAEVAMAEDKVVTGRAVFNAFSIAAANSEYINFYGDTQGYTLTIDAVDGTVTEDSTNLLTSGAAYTALNNLETSNFKEGVITTVLADPSHASNTVLPTEKAVMDAIVGFTNGFIKLDDLSVGQYNHGLAYDNTTGEFSLVAGSVASDDENVVTGASVYEAIVGAGTSLIQGSRFISYDGGTISLDETAVDGTVTANSTNLVTSGAVATAIDNAIVGGVIYKGAWTISPSTTDYSGITLPVKKGYMYYVAGEGPATVGGVEWNVGDYLLVNDDVAAGGSLSGKVEKIDNTESSDVVRLNAVQTLTYKTINANDNTISNLATGNFASGVITTVVAETASASNTVIPTEKAVAEALADATDGMVTLTGDQELIHKTISASDNTITNLGTDNFASNVIVTTVAGTATASNTKIPTEKAVADQLATKVEKFIARNSAITAVDGVCTWKIANVLNSEDVQVSIYKSADGAQVGAYVEVGSGTITVKFNSGDLSANTFKAVVLGL